MISKKTEEQLRTLTDKKFQYHFGLIKIYFEIKNKKQLKSEFGFSENDYFVGSFQKDTEGHDLVSPKLIKDQIYFLK